MVELRDECVGSVAVLTWGCNQDVKGICEDV